jgi:hypothetical protein
MAITKTYIPKTPLEQQYQQFWKVFNKVSSNDEAFCSEFTPNKYASIRSYQDYSIGKKYHICAGIDFKKGMVRIKAYFRDIADYQVIFQSNKERIEGEIGRQLLWKAFNTKGAIILYETANFDKNSQWEEACKVLISNMINMKRVVG